MRHITVLFVSALSLSACEQNSPSLLEMSSPDPAAVLLEVPDAGFRLSGTERETLSRAIDADALERFLSRIRPEHRSAILQDLNELGSQGPVAFGTMTTSIPDPEFRAALAAVFRITREGGARP